MKKAQKGVSMRYDKKKKRIMNEARGSEERSRTAPRRTAPTRTAPKKRPYSPKPSSGRDTAAGNTTQGQAAPPKKSDYSKKAIRLNQKSENKYDRDKALRKKATKAYAKGKDNKAERIQDRRIGVQEKGHEFMKKASQAGYRWNRKKGGRVIKGNSLRFTRKK